MNKEELEQFEETEFSEGQEEFTEAGKLKKAIEVINEDLELDVEPVGKFFNKSVLLEGSKRIEITELSKGQYGYNLKFFTEDGEEYIMSLNKTNKNYLIEKLGKKVSDWKQMSHDHTLMMHGEQFKGTNKTGEDLEGVKVWFTFDM